MQLCIFGLNQRRKMFITKLAFLWIGYAVISRYLSRNPGAVSISGNTWWVKYIYTGWVIWYKGKSKSKLHSSKNATKFKRQRQLKTLCRNKINISHFLMYFLAFFTLYNKVFHCSKIGISSRVFQPIQYRQFKFVIVSKMFTRQAIVHWSKQIEIERIK